MALLYNVLGFIQDTQKQELADAKKGENAGAIVGVWVWSISLMNIGCTHLVGLLSHLRSRPLGQSGTARSRQPPRESFWVWVLYLKMLGNPQMFVVDHHFPMTTNILVDTPISWPGHCKSQEMISYNQLVPLYSSSPFQNWLPSSVLGSKHDSLTNWSPPLASDVPPQSAAFSSSLSVEIHQKCPSEGVPINALPLQK